MAYREIPDDVIEELPPFPPYRGKFPPDATPPAPMVTVYVIAVIGKTHRTTPPPPPPLPCA
jgi:hypothetical protein